MPLIPGEYYNLKKEAIKPVYFYEGYIFPERGRSFVN